MSLPTEQTPESGETRQDSPIQRIVSKYAGMVEVSIREHHLSMDETIMGYLERRRELNVKNPDPSTVFPIQAITLMMGWGIAMREANQPTQPIGFNNAPQEHPKISQEVLAMRKAAARASAQKTMEVFYDRAQTEGSRFLEIGYQVQEDMINLPETVKPSEVLDTFTREVIRVIKEIQQEGFKRDKENRYRSPLMGRKLNPPNPTD